MTLMTALVLVPMIGLAIDGTILYWTKAKLSAAVDAAALAAARSLSVGQTIDAQRASAQSIGVQYLNANFPSGWMGVTTQFSTANIDPEEGTNRTRTVAVSASATVPLYFMRILGHASATVSASGQSSRRDLNLIMVLDRSGSMSTSHSCAPMVTAAKNFMNNFSENRDTLGLITFQTAAAYPYDVAPSSVFKSAITAKLNQLICSGNTSSAQALIFAYNQIHSIDQQGALNVIVFFTDGIPNGVVANYPPTTTTHCTITNNSVGLGLLSDSGGLYRVDQYVDTNRSNTALVQNTSCAFWTRASNVAQDVQYIPSVDYYGNSTSSNTTHYTDAPSDYYNQTAQTSKLTTTGRDNASINATYDAARRIRKDLIDPTKQYKTVIYSIGLGLDAAGTKLIKAVANDPSSSYYDSTQTVGEFVAASDANGLNAAFQKIASEVLRLAR
jgi:Flp pilus assembly protein TadG